MSAIPWLVPLDGGEVLGFFVKTAAQKLISSVPGGLYFYYRLQDHVTRSTAPSLQRVKQKIEVGLDYVRMLDELAGSEALRSGAHLDIGAGWHLTIPLLFWQLGCERQYLEDVRACARADTVFEVVRLMGCCETGDKLRRPLPAPNGLTLEQYLSLLGITYLAPVWGQLPLPAASVSVVTSTQALLHPTQNEVQRIFSEAARVLLPGGLFSATIHLYDLYSDFDAHLSRFNFLRYDSVTWERWFNSRIMEYNRLRASDYARLLEGLPFRVEIWEVRPPTPDDLSALDRIRVSRYFAAYPREELASTHLKFALRRV